MNIFEAADIFQFAIRIEENGEIFYHRAALIADDKNIADIFNHLADEEIIHKRIFQDLLSKVDVHRQPESYKGEYIAYLRDYIDNKAVFTKEVKDSELSNVHDNPVSNQLCHAEGVRLCSLLPGNKAVCTGKTARFDRQNH